MKNKEITKEEEELKIKATIHWIEDDIEEKTIFRWLHETSEGITSYHIATYAKVNFLRQLPLLDFICICDDLDIKWNLIRRILAHPKLKSINQVAFENVLIKELYSIKPKYYTTDFLINHNLQWFIENISRGNTPEHIKLLKSKVLKALNDLMDDIKIQLK